MEHEASTSKISEDQLFYCRQRHRPRGRRLDDRQRLLQAGVRELPMEFAVKPRNSASASKARSAEDCDETTGLLDTRSWERAFHEGFKPDSKFMLSGYSIIPMHALTAAASPRFLMQMIFKT
jgi:hypothetical protein